MNLHDLFAIPRRRTPDKIALEMDAPDSAPDGAPVRFTYAELYGAADGLAAGLQDWGLQKGDRVAFYLSSRPEFVIAYLAVIKLGAIMVPINLRYRRLEIGHILADSQPRLLVTERAQTAILDEVDAVEKSCLDGTLFVENLDTWTDNSPVRLSSRRSPVSRPSPPPPPIKADDLALIMYTSGTTGRSKGAMLTHNNVLATVTGLVAAWAWEPDDRLLLCLPLFHTHGLVVGLHCALAVGATVLLRPRFETEPLLTDLLSGRPTLFFAVPTIYTRLVDAMATLEGPVDHARFDRMRLFCSGSAPLSAEIHVAFSELTGHEILERYGMTETGMNLSNPYAGPRLPGSVGLPLPGVSMRIIQADLDTGPDVAVVQDAVVQDAVVQDVVPGEEGLLLLRGGNVFSGYWRAAEKTATSFVHDTLGRRWFISGDLARQDPDTGYVTLLGRSHELIISGGFNVYPREIEELLESYDGVLEAAVVGQPDEIWGETPVAYLVCAEEMGELDEAALRAFCRDRLASFKTPSHFHRIDNLPRNTMGKLQKYLLK